MAYESMEKYRKSISNIAFIDGQNLYSGTKNNNWKVDHAKFRIYLKEKYNINEAYYFLGFISDNQQELYSKLQKAGFILMFREHSSLLKGNKKGNVDTDIVFSVMKTLLEDYDAFGKVFIVSGDGDYKKLVDFLVKKDKFGKILFPDGRYASSLYNSLGGDHFDALDSEDVKSKIQKN